MRKHSAKKLKQGNLVSQKTKFKRYLLSLFFPIICHQLVTTVEYSQYQVVSDHMYYATYQRGGDAAQNKSK